MQAKHCPRKAVQNQYRLRLNYFKLLEPAQSAWLIIKESNGLYQGFLTESEQEATVLSETRMKVVLAHMIQYPLIFKVQGSTEVQISSESTMPTKSAFGTVQLNFDESHYHWAA